MGILQQFLAAGLEPEGEAGPYPFICPCYTGPPDQLGGLQFRNPHFLEVAWPKRKMRDTADPGGCGDTWCPSRRQAILVGDRFVNILGRGRN